MKYLKLAEQYAKERQNLVEFRNLYQGFRAYNTVAESVWKTVTYFYGIEVAEMLQLVAAGKRNFVNA